jgi:hypothetical protein
MYIWKLGIAGLKSIILAMFTDVIYVYKLKPLTAISI